jgi:hypothetical protein
LQRLGGAYDGYWFTDTLIADNIDWKAFGMTPM